MNGVHDMGGMAGLGNLEAGPDAAPFHAPWEARVLGLTLATAAWGRWTLDRSRYFREVIPGPHYLGITYYERWFTALAALLADVGLISETESRTGRRDPGVEVAAPALNVSQVASVLARGAPTARALDASPRFAVGDRVRARNLHVAGHTRLPRYVRGHYGQISHFHGGHVFPDANAHGQGEQPGALYQVRFSARELWGPDAPARDGVYLDLWEDYLERA
jgi:nitrile hydratase